MVFLSQQFLSQYKDINPFKNSMSEFVYLRTYSRWLEDKKRRETWLETCERVVNYSFKLYSGHKTHEELVSEAEKMFDDVFNLRYLPAGRTLWVGGTEIIDHVSEANFNCSFTAIEKIEDIKDLFYLLMVGTGVGFSVEKKYISKLPKFNNKTKLTVLPYEGVEPGLRKEHTTFNVDNEVGLVVVGDSRNGWADGLEAFLELMCDESVNEVVLNLNNVRPKGERLKKFGGKASGPEPYAQMITKMHEVIAASDGTLKPVDVLDICNIAAENVVAGGVRRCLPAGTLIHTDDGLVRIEDIKPGMMAKTSTGYYRISELIEQGKQEVVTIESQVGPFKCTSKHKIAVLDSPTTYRWVEAGDLKKGDRMVFVDSITNGSKTEMPAWKYEKSAHSTTCKDITIPTLDEDVAWLLGMIHGDGYIHPKFDENGFGAHISIACDRINYPETVVKVKEQLQRFGESLNFIDVAEKENDKSYKVRIKSKQLTWYLAKFKTSKQEIVVPDFILQGLPKIRAAYLAGLFDADGSSKTKPKLACATVYPEYADQIRALYASLGIPTRLKVKTREKDGWQTIYNIKIVGRHSVAMFEKLVMIHSEKYKNNSKSDKSMHDFGFPIDFIRQSDLKRDKSWSYANNQVIYALYKELGGDSNFIPVEVSEVVRTGDVVETFDISVPEVHEFVAGPGLLVHNSAELAMVDADEEEAIYAKKGYWLTGKYHRAMSNNSVAFWEKPTKEYLGTLIESIKESYEPGFINAKAANARRPWFSGFNPCVTADTWVLTEMGPRQVKDLVGVQHGTYVNGELFSTTEKGFWKTGYKKVFKIKTKEGYELRLTDNHQIKKVIAQTQKKQYTDWVETKDLKPGDKIRVHNHRGIMPWDGEGTFEQGRMMGEIVGDGTFYGEKAYLDFWGDSRQQHVDRVNSAVSTKVSRHNSNVAEKVRLSSNEISKLAAKFGIKVVSKEVGPEIEMASYDFCRGFLQGFFDADGTVAFNPEKGSSVRLSQVNLDRLKVVQRMLARIGIISTIYTNRREAGFRSLPDGNGGHADYFCQEMNELCIANDNIDVFHELIGFSEPSKKEKLQLIIDSYKRTTNRERFAVEIESIVEDGYEDVYDCTVPGPSEFDANGIEAHNCVEIILANKGFCNLSTVFVPAFISDKNELELYELEKAVRASARHCLRITNVDISLKEWDKNQKRDRLLGVNLTGVEDAFDRCGIKPEKRGYIFNLLRSAANDEAAKYAKEMRVPTPLLVTTIQPGGTLSQLNASGPCSPGFHKSFAPFIKRTVRISSHDALAKAVLKQGYKVYPDPMSGISSAEFDAMTPEQQKKCLSTVATWVVIFGIKTGAKMHASDESAISQLERYKQYLQDYADHNVSSTIQVGDEEWDQVIDWIHENWDNYIGVSFQNKSNDKYDLPPYEAVTEDEYNEIMKNCPPIDHDLLNKIENGHFTADDDLGNDCAGGACPIR